MHDRSLHKHDAELPRGQGGQGRPTEGQAGRCIAWGGRVLDFGARPLVMGIVNCTPDSFFPGSRAGGTAAALEMALAMIAAGADVVDVGGESTRPGSEGVDEGEELRRVVPVIEDLRRRSQVLVSVDTRKAAVAAAALDAGADLVNDISGLRGNPALAKLVAQRGVPIVLMHMRGEPKTMQVEPHYEDTIAEILSELAASIDLAAAAGIPRQRVIVDPGIGFGKRLEDNLRIVKHLDRFHALGCPVAIGLSRKSFIGTVTGAPVEGRLIGTVVANTVAVLNGADMIRVHDVAPAVEMARMIQALRRVDL
jgi:dihydropteroate synthase